MNGRVMNCNTYKNRQIVDQYIRDFNPYESSPSIKIDLVALTRYAKSVGKKANELKEDEIKAFRRQKRIFIMQNYYAERGRSNTSFFIAISKEKWYIYGIIYQNNTLFCPVPL